MALIVLKRLVDNGKYIFFFLLAFLISALILLDLPLKAKIALIIVAGFGPILLAISKFKSLLIFVLALLIPFYFGTGLPVFLSRIGKIGLSIDIDLQLIDIIVISLLIYRLAFIATHRAEFSFYPSTTIPAFAWIAASALSTINARDVGMAVIQLCHMGKLFLLYIAVANNIEDEADFNMLMTGLLIGTLFEGLLGPFQEITGKTIALSSMQTNTHSEMAYRASGTLGHPNSYAMYLSTTVSFAFAFLFSRIHMLIKVLISLVICAAVLGIILSLSRGGWIGLASVFIFVFGFAFYSKRQSLRNASIVGASSFLILLSLVFGQRHLIETRFTSNDHGSAQSRITMAKGAISIIRDYPLLGVGLNNYALLVPELDPASITAAGVITPVHNIFLLVAAETGLLGFTAFAWLIASLFVQARWLASRAQNEFMWVAGAGIFSGYVALSLHGMVDYALLSNMPLFRLFWLFAGVIAGLRANAFNNTTTNNT